jgi:hypothetical protein
MRGKATRTSHTASLLIHRYPSNSNTQILASLKSKDNQSFIEFDPNCTPKLLSVGQKEYNLEQSSIKAQDMFERVGDAMKFRSKCNYQLVAKNQRTLEAVASKASTSTLNEGHSQEIIQLLAVCPRGIKDIAKQLNVDEVELKEEANKVCLFVCSNFIDWETSVFKWVLPDVCFEFPSRIAGLAFLYR